MTYQKPAFDWLPASEVVGDTITLHVTFNTGINTGVTRVYTKLKKNLFNFPGAYTAPDFPDSLFDIPIDMKIVSQNRTQIKVIFPTLPKGVYNNYASSGGNAVYDASFGLYFNFSSQAWGDDNLLAAAAYIFEVK